MSNPLEEKIYYIYESIYSSSCKDIKPSRISIKNNSYKDYTMIGPMNLIEAQIYLFNETTKLNINIQLAHRCDTSGFVLNTNKDACFPVNCSMTFKNFSTEYLNNLKTTISNYNGSYSSQIDYTSSSPFLNFAYTDSYLQSKTTPNDWKPLCQRYSDIGKMLTDLNNILSSINESPEKETYKDKYNQILKLYQENKEIRENLEKKLEVITNSGKYKDSKEMLHSTIYISVLWTILATSLLFYVFKKL